MTNKLDISDVTKLQLRDGREVVAVFENRNCFTTVFKNKHGVCQSLLHAFDGRMDDYDEDNDDLIVRPTPKVKHTRWGFFTHLNSFMFYGSRDYAEKQRMEKVLSGFTCSEIITIEGEV